MHYGGVGRLHTYRAGINIVLGLKVSPTPNLDGNVFSDAV